MKSLLGLAASSALLAMVGPVVEESMDFQFDYQRVLYGSTRQPHFKLRVLGRLNSSDMEECIQALGLPDLIQDLLKHHLPQVVAAQLSWQLRQVIPCPRWHYLFCMDMDSLARQLLDGDWAKGCRRFHIYFRPNGSCSPLIPAINIHQTAEDLDYEF